MKTPGKRRSPPRGFGPWLILTVGLLAIGTFLGYALYLEDRDIEKIETDRLQTQMNVIDANLSRQLESVNLVLVSLLKELPTVWTKDDKTRLSRMMVEFTDAIPGVRGMGVLDAKGYILASRTPQTTVQSFASRDYFQVPLHHPDASLLYLSPPFKSATGTYTMSLTKMIPGPAGEFNGVVTAALDAQYFSVLLESVRFAPDMTVSLVHQGGQLFLAAPQQDAAPGQNVNVPGSFLSQHLAGNQTVTVFRDRSRGTSRGTLFMARSILPKNVPLDTYFVVLATRDMRVILADWRSGGITYSLLYLLTIAVSITTLWYLRRRQKKFALESHRLQEMERVASERLKLATEAAEVGVWEFEFANEKLTWEDTMFTLYGMPKEAFSGDYEAWKSALLPEDAAQAEAQMQDSIQGGHPFNTSFRIRRPDGKIRFLRAIAKVFSDGEGNPVRLIGINQDVTPIVEAQIQLEQLNAALKERTAEAEAASRSKSEFLANMSHEIRTPMNAVLGLLYLAKQTGLTPNQLDYITKSEASAKSLLALLNDILDFSKVEAGKVEVESVAFDFPELLHNLSVILGTVVMDKDVEILIQTSPHMPRTLMGDALRIHQVLLNLAGNAIKFTEKGEVLIQIDAKIDAAEAEVSFSVKDTGIGIEPEMLEGIFQGFVQAETSTTRRYGGTGLGLAISRHLVELMGGRLEVESVVGKGSNFHFVLKLPFAEGEVSVTQPKSMEKPLRVLIIDDNPTARQVFASMVASFGWIADTAPGGPYALDRIQAEGNGQFPYDIVFVDWKMPEMDGWETTQRIRKLVHGDKVPLIIMVTAHGREILAQKFRTNSDLLDGFLVKPVTPSMLFDMVADIQSGQSVLAMPSAGPTVSKAALAGMRLLVVEDNKTNQIVAKGLLESEHAEVVLVSGGRAALQLLEEGQKFHAVLMDIQMPDMDGYETTRRIRQRWGSELPIIAMTANVLSGERERCLEAGMNDHLGKPIEIDKLLTLLSHLKPATPTEKASFDTVAALQRLDGNAALMDQVVKDFLSWQKDFMTRLWALEADGRRKDSLRELHTLKGLAATVGAEALARQAAETEALLAGGKPLGAADSESLEQALREAFDVLSQFLPSVSATEKPVGNPPEGEADLQALGDGLTDLEALLTQRNMAALKKLTELAPLFVGKSAETFALLKKAVDDLNFAAALQECQKLREALFS